MVKIWRVPEWPKEQTVNLPAPLSMVRIRPLHHILKEIFLRVTCCGHRIMANTSAFQADDAGSIPQPAPLILEC